MCHKLSCEVLSVGNFIIYLMFIQMVKLKFSCFPENFIVFLIVRAVAVSLVDDLSAARPGMKVIVSLVDDVSRQLDQE